MDEYTKKTRRWLDDRFSRTDEAGVYMSHAPIYGFARDPFALGLYRNNYAVLKEAAELSGRLGIETLLEAGCAEGFTAGLVEKLFGLRVTVCDLSPRAVERAGKIYGLQGFAADVQDLGGVATGSFDLVLCSETIEHVPDPGKAFAELVRVARKAVIITVPAANSEAEKKSYVPPELPHTHLNIFTRADLERYLPGCRIQKISNRWLGRFEGLFTGAAAAGPEDGLRLSARLYRRLGLVVAPVASRLYGIRLAKAFILADRLACALFPGSAHTYMAIFEKTPPEAGMRRRVTGDILDFMLRRSSVPPYNLLHTDRS